MIACIIGFPTVTAVLAFKAAGELLTTFVRYLVIKTETILLKRAELKYVKTKTFVVACLILFADHMLMSTSVCYTENWTFMESVYAWFVTFSTIGFGDYVPFESLRRKMDRGEITTSRIVIYSASFYFPFFTGLCLTSCILNCLVDSLDQIRDFRDRKCMECCLALLSFKRRVLCCKKEENQVDCARQ